MDDMYFNDTYIGGMDIDDTPPTYNWEGEAVQEAQQRVRDIYAEGVPFFTIPDLRLLWEQLKNLETSGGHVHVTVKRIDGQKVKLGPFKHPDEDTHEAQRIGVGLKCYEVFQEKEGTKLVAVPSISYNSVRDMVKYSAYQSCDSMFLPLRVVYVLQRRDAETGDVLHNDRDMGQSLYEKITKRFEKSFERWKASQTRRRLETMLKSAFDRGVVPPLHKIMGIGLSSFIRGGHFNERSACQHSMMSTLRDFFAGGEGRGGPLCLIQDPLYEKSDQIIFGKMRLRVVRGPQCFLEMDYQSIVVLDSSSSGIPIQDIIVDIARPAMMIWDDAGAELGKKPQPDMTDPISPRLAKMLAEEYDRFDFCAGENCDSPGVAGLAFYIRRWRYAS